MRQGLAFGEHRDKQMFSYNVPSFVRTQKCLQLFQTATLEGGVEKPGCHSEGGDAIVFNYENKKAHFQIRLEFI